MPSLPWDEFLTRWPPGPGQPGHWEGVCSGNSRQLLLTLGVKGFQCFNWPIPTWLVRIPSIREIMQIAQDDTVSEWWPRAVSLESPWPCPRAAHLRGAGGDACGSTR